MTSVCCLSAQFMSQVYIIVLGTAWELRGSLAQQVASWTIFRAISLGLAPVFLLRAKFEVSKAAWVRDDDMCLGAVFARQD